MVDRLELPRTTRVVPTERAPAEVTDVTRAITRADVRRLAVARDPGLSERAHRVRALLHAARAEGALPAPEADVQVWNLPLARPYALGEAGMYMAEYRQMFPAPGSLDARSRAAAEEARGALAELSTREQEVLHRVDLAYADYVGATLHHAVHTQHLGVLAEMLDVARGRYASGGASMADIARIEGELASTRRTLNRYTTDRDRSRAALDALLQRPTDDSSPLGPPRDLDPETVRLSLDELLARAGRTRGDLSMARARARAAHARAEAADAEATWPAFSVSLSYFQDPMQRPGVGGMASMTLPWVWAGARERLGAARETESAERDAVESASVDVRRTLGPLRAALAGIERDLVILRTETRPATERAADANRAAYIAGQSDLVAWLDATRLALDTAMEEADARAELGRTLADLEWAVGQDLPRVPAATGPLAQDHGGDHD